MHLFQLIIYYYLIFTFTQNCFFNFEISLILYSNNEYFIQVFLLFIVKFFSQINVYKYPLQLFIIS